MYIEVKLELKYIEVKLELSVILLIHKNHQNGLLFTLKLYLAQYHDSLTMVHSGGLGKNTSTSMHL